MSFRFILSLVLFLCLRVDEAYLFEGGHSNGSVVDGIVSKFDYLEEFNENAFSNGFFPGQENVSLEDFAKLDHLVEEMEERSQVVGKQYCFLLRDMVERGSMESFKTLYPRVKFSLEDDYDVLLMVQCAAYSQYEILDFMMDQSFDADRFVNRLEGLAEYFSDPFSCVEVVPLVASNSQEIDAREPEIYTKLLNSILYNEYAFEHAFVMLAVKLIDLGATVDEDLISEVQDVYPDNGPLHELLFHSKSS